MPSHVLASSDSHAPGRRHARSLPRLRHARAARRPAARPGHRQPRGAHLRHRLVRLRRLRPRRRALQHGALRPRVLADLEPHRRRLRGTDGGARERRRRDRDGERAGRAAPCDRHADGRRRAHRGQPLAVRRLAQPARLHARTLRHRHDLHRPARPRRLGAIDPAEHAVAVRRDARQSGARRARHSGGRGHRAPPGVAADGRLDVHHAVPDDAVRSRRRPRLSLGDQVHRRPRRGDRRRADRRRHLRLARQRQIPDADRALRRVPRNELRRGEHRRAVPAARPARGTARLRRLHEPAHRVLPAAGARDAAAADAAPRRQRPQGGRVPGEPRRRSSRLRTPTCPRIRTTRSRSACCRAGAARCSAST